MATENKFERDAEAIAENNPKVDLSMVREAQKLIAERRAQGWERRGYNLVSPHSRSLPAR